jgi:fatty-acid desaturase
MDKMSKYAEKELENSKRIFKSATPKYTIDWYVKWVASAFVLSAMAIRGIPEFTFVDLSLSAMGVFLWLIVSIIWNDRALIILNGVGLVFLIKNLIDKIV